MSKDPLYEQVLVDLQRLDRARARIELKLSALDAWLLLSSLQLALRHPNFPAQSRPVVLAIAQTLAAGLSCTPALKELAACGFDAKFDVPHK